MDVFAAAPSQPSPSRRLADRALDDVEKGGVRQPEANIPTSTHGSPHKRLAVPSPVQSTVGPRAASPSKDRNRGLAPLMASVGAEFSAAAAAATSPGRHHRRVRLALATVLLLAVLAAAAFGAHQRVSQAAVDAESPRRSDLGIAAQLVRAASSNLRRTSATASPPDTLVMYVYSNSDPEYERNLRYFVANGVHNSDGCDYIIVIQGGAGMEPPLDLPALPPNAHYVPHVNACYDWGTMGWLLSSGRVDASKYKFLLFLNSSTRGPFLPAYWPVRKHWSTAFTSRITDDVKLVGSTISCEGSRKAGDPTEERANAHVQSYVTATDQVGLSVLLKDPGVFACYEDMQDTIWYSELGASLAILDAGFNLDSLMTRYRGIDWRDRSFWGCNAGQNPTKENSLDGINLHPFEVLFVKVKGFLLDLKWTSAREAATLDRWMSSQGDQGAVSSNVYLEQQAAFKEVKMQEMALVGPACFDAAFYAARNADLPPLTPADLWLHFLHNGQFEGRPFRLTCGAPLAGETYPNVTTTASAQAPASGRLSASSQLTQESASQQAPIMEQALAIRASAPSAVTQQHDIGSYVEAAGTAPTLFGSLQSETGLDLGD